MNTLLAGAYRLPYSAPTPDTAIFLMVTTEHAHDVAGLGTRPVVEQLPAEVADQETQTGTVTSVPEPPIRLTQLTLSALRTTQVARVSRSPHVSPSLSPSVSGSVADTQLPRRPTLAAVYVEFSVPGGVSSRKYTPRSYFQAPLLDTCISTYTLAKLPLPEHVPTCGGDNPLTTVRARALTARAATHLVEVQVRNREVHVRRGALRRGRASRDGHVAQARAWRGGDGAKCGRRRWATPP